MMSEYEEEQDAGGNPFEDVSEQPNARAAASESVRVISSDSSTNAPRTDGVELAKSTESAPSTPSSLRNPFANDSGNPFETECTDNAVYENISLTTPALEAIKLNQRDWDGEWEHVASCVKKNFTSVTVMSPEVVSSMMTKHVVYTVKSEPQKYVVRRRYNDFAWLRDTLAATYEGLFIPSIPATTVFSKNALTGGSKTDVNGDFVKNRMQQLQLFMHQISKIPFLRTDPSLNHFLSVQNEKEFKQITEAPVAVTNGGGVDNWTNVGLNMWLRIVDNTPLHAVAAERLVADFKRQLDVLAHRLNLVDNECRLAGKRAVLAATAMGALSDQVSNWAGVEADLADPAKNEYVDPCGKAKKAHMEGLAAGHAHWANSTAMVPRILARLLMSHVQFQQVQVARFREHLGMRDALLKDLEKAEREKLKAQEEKQRAASPSKRQSRSIMFGKGPEELEEALQRKTEHVAQLQARVDRITRALTFCEIHRFNKDRLQGLTALIGALAAAQLQLSQATTARWNDIAGALGVDVAQYTEGASSLLTSATALDEDLLGFNGGTSEH